MKPTSLLPLALAVFCLLSTRGIVRAQEDDQNSRLTLEATRQPVVPEDDLCRELLLHQEEILLPSADDPRLVVASYRAAGDPGSPERDCSIVSQREMVVVWRQTDSGYVRARSAEGVYATAERFRFDGETYLVLSQVWLSATRSIEELLLLYVTPEAQTLPVYFAEGAFCGGAYLAPLSDDFEHNDAILRFSDDAITFETNIWNAEDSYKFPTGGYAEGTMAIVRDSTDSARRRLVVKSCEVVDRD